MLPTRKAQRPPNATGVLRIEAEPGASDSALSDWRIYTLGNASAPEWINLKLLRVRPGAGRASYWLGWNLKTQALARGWDYRAMPDALRAALVDELKACAYDGRMAGTMAADALRECDELDARRAALS